MTRKSLGKSYIIAGIDPELWQAVKVRAIQEGLSISQLIFKVLMEYLEKGRE
jgi:predicted HicB family RNase H-like nuclease